MTLSQLQSSISERFDKYFPPSIWFGNAREGLGYFIKSIVQESYEAGEAAGRKEEMLATDEEWRLSLEESGDISIIDGEKRYEIRVKNWSLLHELIKGRTEKPTRV